MNETTEAIEKVKRVKLLCEDCWMNQGGFAGAAMTDWTCEICKGQHIAGSTATPAICKGCALAFGLCEDCGKKDHIYKKENS